jgi:phosphocarrier protein
MSEPVVTRNVVVANRLGVHARAAVMLVTAARRFDAKILIRKGVHEVDATEVLQVLSLGAAQGEWLSLEAVGSDAPAAIDELEQLFLRKFDEDEDEKKDQNPTAVQQ